MTVKVKKKEETLESLWSDFLASVRRTERVWERIVETRTSLPIDEKTKLSRFAVRCLSSFRRQHFIGMFPSFLIYTKRCGGIKEIK